MKAAFACLLSLVLASTAYGIGSVTNSPWDGYVIHTEPDFTYVRSGVPSVRSGQYENWVQYETNFWADPGLSDFQYSSLQPASSIPEPSSMALAGVAGLALLRRRSLN